MGKEKYVLNGIRICIDQLDNEIKGRAYMPLSKEELSFFSCRDLLLQCDNIFEENGYPQSFQEKRSFDQDKKESGGYYHGIPKAVMSGEEILSRHGKQKTFDVVVESRRNTTWQGVVKETGTDKLTRFHGELELIDALSDQK